MSASPRSARRIAPTAVRRDQDERTLARDDGRLRSAPPWHVRLVAFRPATVYTRLMRGRLVLLACLAISCARIPIGAAPRSPHVYLIVVDGLDPQVVTPANMPRLFDLVAHSPEHTSFFPAAHAIMPARTNPNHVTLLTGVYADVHGITGNAYWSRDTGARPRKLEDPALIEVETLFTVAESTHPARVTLAAFGKPKLARLFAGVPGRQRAPDMLWSPEELPTGRRDPVTGYAPDAETMHAALALMAQREPDFTFMNLSDVDRTGHALGPASPEYARAATDADAALGTLVDDLRARGRWDRSVLIVTADHGMGAVAPTPERPHPVISLGLAVEKVGVVAVGEGGLEHLYADGGADLGRAAALAAETPGVTEVLARVPVGDVPLVDARHPDWHLDHPRAGDLLLVAAAGYQFVDPTDPVDAALRGNHGGPGERDVPLFFTGGWPGLRHATGGEPGLVDVTPTIATLLELRAPRRLDGSAVPPERAGHPIDAVPGQRPH